MVALSIFALVAVVAIRPHADLMREPGTKKYKDLSDTNAWKAFLGEIILKLQS